MDIIIEKGNAADIDELERLYDSLNDALAAGINYPGWRKGIYPVREDAQNGLDMGMLYVARSGDRIAGSIILSHKEETGYDTVEWPSKAKCEDAYIIHTFTVHPDYMKQGIGLRLMQFAEKQAGEDGMTAVRLDVFEKNAPAIHLYEKCGYQYIKNIDEGLGQYGLDTFRVYEKIL